MVPDSMLGGNPWTRGGVIDTQAFGVRGERRKLRRERPFHNLQTQSPRGLAPFACGPASNIRVDFLIVTTQTKFGVGLVQMAVSHDPRENLARAIAKIEEAVRGGAQVVCLPELFQSQYFCQREDTANFDLAEAVPGPTTEALGRVAQKAKVVVVAPLFERRAAGVYHNTAAIIDADGKIAGVYRKMHIPDDPAYYEKFYFTPGDLGFRAFTTQAGKIATLICWDQWYPEGARLAALQGP